MSTKMYEMWSDLWVGVSLKQLDVSLLYSLHLALVLQLHSVGGEEDDVGHQHRGHMVADLGSRQHF